MKKVLLAILLIVLAIVGYYVYKFSTDKSGGFDGDKAEKLSANKHSAAFNNNLDAIMNEYFKMKDAFVKADTATVKSSCSKMITLSDSLLVNDLKNDTSGVYETISPLLQDVKSNAASLLTQTKIEEMRMDFKQVNEQLYAFLKALKYEGKKLYWQNCPMAFGEGKDGSWISNTDEVINPYLGNNHPEYKGTMLHCGETKDSIVAQ